MLSIDKRAEKQIRQCIDLHRAWRAMDDRFERPHRDTTGYMMRAYSKMLYLRELISNASDAIDKLYYKSLADGATGLNRDDFQIFLAADKDSRTLRIRDNGIGMTQEELDQNLGVIAKSGSLKFKSENEKNEDIDIIGQFGVGFYAAYMVAKHVEDVSRAAGSDEANR